MIEILISLTVTAIILVAVTTFYMSSQRTMAVGNALVGIQGDARSAMYWISRDLRRGVRLEATHGSYTTGNSSIVVRIPSIDTLGNVVNIALDFDYVVYRLQTGDPHALERILDAKNGVSDRNDDSTVVARNMSSLSFSHNGVGLASIPSLDTVNSVNVNLSTAKRVMSGVPTERLTSVIELRNWQGTH